MGVTRKYSKKTFVSRITLTLKAKSLCADYRTKRTFIKVCICGMSPEKISIKKQKETLARYLKEVKEKNPCMDCKISYPYYMMDFDHVRGQKHANVAELINTLSKKRIDEEIAKCEVVCSNCHRIRTHMRKMRKAG
jgi:hypothetical protein